MTNQGKNKISSGWGWSLGVTILILVFWGLAKIGYQDYRDASKQKPNPENYGQQQTAQSAKEENQQNFTGRTTPTKSKAADANGSLASSTQVQSPSLQQYFMRTGEAWALMPARVFSKDKNQVGALMYESDTADTLRRLIGENDESPFQAEEYKPGWCRRDVTLTIGEQVQYEIPATKLIANENGDLLTVMERTFVPRNMDESRLRIFYPCQWVSPGQSDSVSQ